jgi:hypothetical protein
MVLLAIGVYSLNNAIFSVLRAVRMLRFIKMAKSWRSLQVRGAKSSWTSIKTIRIN